MGIMHPILPIPPIPPATGLTKPLPPPIIGIGPSVVDGERKGFSMERPNEDVLARLNHAVDALDEQIALTHAVLADQLNEALTPLDLPDTAHEIPATPEIARGQDEPSPDPAVDRSLSDHAAQLERMLEETRAAHAEALGQTQSESIRALERLSAAEDRAGQLEKDLEAASQSNAALSAQYEATEKSVRGLNTQIEALRDEVRQWRDRAEDAEEDLEQAQTRMAAFEAKLDEEKAESTRWHAEAQQAWSQIAAMEKERQKVLEVKASAESERREALSHVRTLESERQEAASRAHALESAHHEAEARSESLESERHEAMARIQALESELEQMRAALDEARSKPAGGKEEALTGTTFRARDAKGRKRRFGEVLIEAGVLTPAQVEEIAEEQAANPQRKFGTLVVELGYSTDDVVARVLAAQLGLAYTALSDEDIDPKAVALAPAHLARQHLCVPVRREGNFLWLAMANPMDLIAIEDFELATGLRVEPLAAKAASIQFVIDRYSPGG